MGKSTPDSFLAELRAHIVGRRVCLLAIGNPHNGDDAAGPSLIRRFEGRAFPATMIDVGTAPEEYLGAIRAAGPELVLIIDAIDFHGQAGDVAFLRSGQIRKNKASSHHGSLNAFATALVGLAGVQEVLILGIQPGRLGRHRQLSEPVERTLDALVRMLKIVLPETRAAPRRTSRCLEKVTPYGLPTGNFSPAGWSRMDQNHESLRLD